MTKEVKFYWWKSFKIWKVSGHNIEQITKKCDELCAKYNAIHFEIM